MPNNIWLSFLYCYLYNYSRFLQALQILNTIFLYGSRVIHRPMTAQRRGIVYLELSTFPPCLVQYPDL